MQVDIQYKIKNNLNSIKYLRENSYWYKNLNRNPKNISSFETKMKEAYKITTGDRINKMVDGLETLSKFINILK